MYWPLKVRLLPFILLLVLLALLLLVSSPTFATTLCACGVCDVCECNHNHCPRIAVSARQGITASSARTCFYSAASLVPQPCLLLSSPVSARCVCDALPRLRCDCCWCLLLTRQHELTSSVPPLFNVPSCLVSPCSLSLLALMTSHLPTGRLRQSGRFQPRQPQPQLVDANSLFASKAALVPPSSSSSFLSAWEQHSAASSSASSAFAGDERVDSGDEQPVDSVELELPAAKTEKSAELADAVPLLRPPRRSNDPMFRTIPLRTQSTASPPPQQPTRPSTYSTLTSYASAPSKRQLDESFISSSQPLPSERWQDDDEPMVQSPAATKQKTVHLSPPKTHTAAPSNHTSSPPLSQPSSTITDQPAATISADAAATTAAVTSTSTATALAAATKLAVESAVEQPIASMRSSLQSVSAHVYELSQYHLLLGICLMREGELQEASEQFTVADRLFQPALDLLPAAAFAEQRADMLTMRAKATTEAALALQTKCGEKESELAKSEREERTRKELEKAKELYAAAINADDSQRGELWNDLCLFLLRVGELQTAGQLLELLVGVCGDCLDLFVNLGVLHAVYGDAEAASDYFQHVLARSPQHVTALVNYASSLSVRQQHKAAVRILKLAHQLHPTSVLVLNNLAVEYGVQGDHMAAAAWLQMADESGYENERVATVSLTFNTANEMLALACEQSDEEVRNKLLDGADALLSNELAKETKDRESQIAVLLRLCRGNVCTEKLRSAQASGDRESAQKLFASAESDYMAALVLQPDNSDVWVQMCGLYEEHHERGRAKEIYARLLDTLSFTSSSLPASAVPLLNNLALLLMDDNQHKEAVEMLKLAKAVLEPLTVSTDATATPSSPSSPASPSPSSTAGLPSSSTIVSSVGLSSVSTQLASVLVNLSHCQQRMGELEAALQSLQYAHRLRPAHLSTLAGLSSVYVQQGAWQEAEAGLDEAARLVAESGKEADTDLIKRNKRTLVKLKERSQVEAGRMG